MRDLVDMFGFWPLLELVSCLAIFVAMLSYQRAGSRFRVGYAWMAWSLIAGTATTAVKLIAGVPPPPQPFEASLCAICAILVLWFRGDVAHLSRAVIGVLRRCLKALHP